MNFKDIMTESQQSCPHCGGPVVEYSELAEGKKDACYYKIKATAKVWPSAYASGRLVQCRKKGAANYGSKSEGVAEDASSAYIFIQGDFDGDTASTGPTHGSQLDQQTTPIQFTRGRMSNVRRLSGPSPEGGKTIKQARIPLTLVIGNQKFSTTGVDLQLTVAPNGYVTNGEFGRVIGTAVVKIMQPESVAEAQLHEKCWDGYQQQGMKNKGGRQVPNCVATESALSDLPRPGKRNQFRSLHKIRKQRGLDEQGVAEEYTGNIKMNEKYNAEYDDEAGMADNNLETLARAVEGIDDLIQTGDNLPEWCQEKIAVAKSMLVAVWDYMYSEEASDEVDPEIDAMFEAMNQLVHETAHAQQLSVDLVWESFESLPDHMLYETAAWRRKEGKSKKGGLNARGVASYRRENPGSKLQMAVTTKPSKLKPGSKAAKRRKSFCARMSGVKGPMKKPNGKPTRKALALRKWNC